MTPGNPVEKFLGHWLNFIQHKAWLVLIMLLTLSGAAVFYIKDNLGINTDTADMLSEELDWRQNHLEFKTAFPQLSDTIAIVIEGSTPDQVQDTTIELAARLEKEKSIFTNVSHVENSGFFRKNSLLYLDTDELYDLVDDLSAVQPFLARLKADQNLRGLFSVLQEALEQTSEEVDLDRIFSATNKTITAHLNGESDQMSWHKLMSQREISPEDLRAVITVNPRLDYSELLPGKPAIEALRQIIDKVTNEMEFDQLQIRLTGSVALAYEELNSVAEGAKAGGIIALFAVSAVLIFGLGSFSLVISALVTLITGLIWTAAFATFAIGELNMISVAFMLLYIGLGVDFAIHLCLSFREKNSSIGKQLAVISSGKHIGVSLFLCAFTTAIGFYAFLPTSYSGVAELGLISGTGMFISLFLTLTLLPALLTLLPSKATTQTVSKTGANRFSSIQNLPITHAKPITLFALILGLGSLVLVTKIVFDHNPIHLMDPETESVQTYQDLLAESSRSPLSIDIISATIGDLPERLAALESVGDVITVDSFIPPDQDEKLALIDELSLVMGSDFDEIDAAQTISNDDRLTTLQNFNHVLIDKISAGQASEAAKALHENIEHLLRKKTTGLIQLESDLLGSLAGRLQRLDESLAAEEITQPSLPDNILSSRVTADQQYRIEVFPKLDLDNNQALEQFVSAVRSVAPTATGVPIINLEASKAVINAFQQAFALALLVISIFLWLLLEKNTDVLVVLAPLILAGLLTGASSVIFNLPINFANIIALPLLLGIGVDSAVHILHRYRTALPIDGKLLGTSTAKAVLLSALTSACSFGNLAISPHQGTASMGILLTIGLSLTVFTTLLVLPSLLTITTKKGNAI